MSSDAERVRDWLSDIVENIDRVTAHVAGLTRDIFDENLLVIDAAERCIERITEAALRIGPERMASIAPDLPLHKLRGLSNRLRHEYELIDARVIWDTIESELPLLRAACVTALQ